MLDKKICERCWKVNKPKLSFESHIRGYLNRSEEWFCPHKLKRVGAENKRVLQATPVSEIADFCPYWKEHRDYEVMVTLENDR